MSNMRYIYHYCASKSRVTKTSTFDGLAIMENRITSIGDYRSLKRLIVDQMLGNDESVSDVIISSLSLIDTEIIR
jgi:hypothetical protein